jgi:23S rRNA (adenine2503-C2)-methyltransferase
VLKVLSVRGADGGPRVVVAETADGHRIDCARSSEPGTGEPLLRLSTLVGCPVRCTFCDAGGGYEGRLTAPEMLGQLELLARDTPRFVVDFSRMGEPAFNPAVLEVLRQLPARLGPRLLAVHLSTMGPERCADFYEGLERVLHAHYPDGRLRLQLSLHTTDEAVRARVIPVRCLPPARLAALGERLHVPEGRKVALHFALARELPLEPERLRAHFHPDVFRVTLSPLHPTQAAARAGFSASGAPDALLARIRAAGYAVDVLPADEEEQAVGAACGMYTGEGREGPPRPRRTLVRD